ncbi:unnamed protein product, partial [Mesorhabditis belari]|uniref:UDP-N-acetylglucosamine 4-epimerase n=1 Tax=Mesorhabditis belari TaxID=2138241 RepID=A0AAF3ED39_9BILA
MAAPIQLPNLDAILKSLGSYAGRDKALRTIYFMIQLHAQRSLKGKEWMAIAKQMSTTRMVLRQLNGPTQYKALQALPGLSRILDKFDFTCVSTVTVAYSIYWAVELIAWLSDSKVLPYDSVRLFRYCLYLWLVAIVAGFLKQIREVYRKRHTKGWDDLVTLLGLTCEGISAINMLPHKLLWAGKLQPKHSATLSLIASAIGWSYSVSHLVHPNQMHILVTGAAGFIGSHTVLELLQAGYQVYCIDNFANSISDESGEAISLKRVAELTGKSVPFEKADVCDVDALDRIFSKHKFDGLIHLAALKSVGESSAKPFEYYQNNIVASLNLIQMCQKYNVKSFVFSSSATVYGPPSKLPITENDQTGVGITNPYGQTKYMMEQILIDVGKAHKDWNIILLRYFNPVGAHPSGRIGEDPQGVPNNLMPFVSQVAIGRLPVVTVFGTKWNTPDGTGVRDYIHIVDLAKGHVMALDRIKREGHVGTEIFNLGTGRGYSVLEMVAALEKASGRKIPTKEGEPRPGDIASVYCDPALAKEKLGWTAEFGLEEMCRDLWNWQSQNPKEIFLQVNGRSMHAECRNTRSYAGKTTLTRAIASLSSTNAFDKHAGKEGRHNTIDLGFSSLVVDGRRLALIDCPGHASLIRSVLAASTVFDMALVVVDAQKGIEQQTAEHLLLAALFCPKHVLVVLNKIDLIEENEIDPAKKRVRKALKAIGISEETPIIPCSVLQRPEAALSSITNSLNSLLYEPTRNISSPFLMAIDHCFPIKGKGTVLTGTVLEGIVKINTEIEIPILKEKCKVKGIQSWKESVDKVSAGERGALLVSNLSSDSLDRALISAPNTLSSIQNLIATTSSITFFKDTIQSGRKLHISTGFETLMGTCQFLRKFESEYERLTEIQPDCLVFLQLAKPIYSKIDSIYVASTLDHQGKGCRFPFHGQFQQVITDEKTLRIFTRKQRQGIVERIENDRSVICKDLFKKESKIEIYERMEIILSTGEIGRIEHSFGKGGKARISIRDGLKPETIEKFEAKNGEIEVILHLKKYLADRSIRAYLPEMATSIISRIGICCFQQRSFAATLLLNSRCTISTSRINRASTADEEDDGLPKDYKLKIIRPGSRRLDTFVNRTCGKSSSQVEKLILTGKVRVNEEAVTKRAYNIQQGDVIDVWNQDYPENKDLAEIDRAEVVDYEVTANGYDIKIKHWRKFLVENWRGGSGK